jgi:hypothetical protein
MKWHLALLLIVSLAYVGCGKKEQGPAAREVTAPKPLENNDGAAPPPPDPTAPPADAPPPQPTEGGDPPRPVETLNSQLSEYLANGGKMPSTMEELARLKLVPQIPAAPPGKKFVIDSNKRKVIMVNQ